MFLALSRVRNPFNRILEIEPIFFSFVLSRLFLLFPVFFCFRGSYFFICRAFVFSCFRGSFFSISFVALDAQLFLSIESQGKFIGTAHEVMAGNTGNTPLRSGINRVFAYGMRELGMPFMTGRAHLEFLVAEEKPQI